jgi:Domain of unknown function (DUF4406)
MKSSVIYILGPMCGHAYYNFPAFDTVRDSLIAQGHTVISPADLDRGEGFDPFVLPITHDWVHLPKSLDLQDVITRDIAAIMRCDAYWALPGWEHSVGARAEKALLDWRYAEWLNPHTSPHIPPMPQQVFMPSFTIVGPPPNAAEKTLGQAASIQSFIDRAEARVIAARAGEESGRNFRAVMQEENLKAADKKQVTPPVTPQVTGPNRPTIIPDEAKERKTFPIASGVLDYFPDAIAAVSNVSFTGNEQHNPGQPLFWNRSKSMDEADTLLRHFMQRGTRDKDGTRHSAKVAWRALALLQKEIEAEKSVKSA